MIPVHQTLTMEKDGRGNCKAACLASILEIDLSDVVDTSLNLDDPIAWWDALYKWLDAQKLVRTTGRFGEFDASGYTIGWGPSPRGNFSHAVVCYDGEIVFDPHPSGAGLLEIQGYDRIEREGSA